MMRVDANCTIRNSDLRKYTTPGLGGVGSSTKSHGSGRRGSFRNKSLRQLKRNNEAWEDTLRSSANGVILNYEQRIRELEGDSGLRGGKESPRSLQEVPGALVRDRVIGSTITRVPSAPSTGDRMRQRTSLQHSLLSL